jgi:UDPglucose 6-dehydrogenase
MEVVALLLNEGARIHAYDPAVALDHGRVPAAFRPIVCDDPVEAAAGADALAILTDWPEFREIDLEPVRAAMAGRVLFDGRNMLDKATVEQLGFAYLGVGRIATAQRRRRSDLCGS